MQARSKISAPRRYLPQMGRRKDGSSIKIMVGGAALGWMRSVVKAHLHADFITICSPSTARQAILF